MVCRPGKRIAPYPEGIVKDRGDEIIYQFIGENENLCPPIDTSYIRPPMV